LETGRLQVAILDQLAGAQIGPERVLSAARSAATTLPVRWSRSRRLLIACPDSDVHAENDYDEVDGDGQPVVRADMCVEAAWAQMEPVSAGCQCPVREPRIALIIAQ
jgi:hypothetical protein